MSATPLIVSLSVGVPVIVAGGYIYFLIRRRKLLKQEDASRQDIDAELQDTQLYVDFEEELHRQMPAKDVADEDTSNESTVVGTDTLPPKAYLKKAFVAQFSPTPSCRSLNKSASAYDFYDTFIPVMPVTDLSLTPPRKATAEGSNTQLADKPGSSPVSIDESALSKSREALMVQLHNPIFFLKLQCASPALQSASFHSLAELCRSAYLELSKQSLPAPLFLKPPALGRVSGNRDTFELHSLDTESQELTEEESVTMGS